MTYNVLNRGNMKTLEAIQTRRSVKHYDADHEMSEAETRKLLSLAMLSPTAYNLQNWRFITVIDKALRKQLRDAAWTQSQVTDTSLFIYVCRSKSMG